MKLAIMQPYFFPYVGYWQLLHACDKFILADDVQFIRHGWIERNRILNPAGGWLYTRVPLQRHPHKAAIRDVRAQPGFDWQRKLIAQLSHYKPVAPYFHEARDAIANLVTGIEEASISRINAAILRGLAPLLGIEREIVVSSEQGFDYSSVQETADWAIAMCRQSGADVYLNPVGGAHLYDARSFKESGIRLMLLEAFGGEYDRKGPFEPALSIIDVMMFNGLAGTASLLPQYKVTSLE